MTDVRGGALTLVALDEEQRVRLAAAAKKAQRELRLNQREVAERGGFSQAVYNRIVNARSPSLSESTLDALCVGLQWQRGSAELVMEGGSPLPEDAGEVHVEEFRDTEGVVRRRVVAHIEPADPAADLSAAWARLNEDLERASPHVRQVVSRLAAGLLAEADDLLGALTDVSTLTASDRPQGSPRSQD